MKTSPMTCNPSDLTLTSQAHPTSPVRSQYPQPCKALHIMRSSTHGVPPGAAGAPSHASTHPRQHMPTPATAGPRAGPSTGYQHTPSYQHAAANAVYSQHAAQRTAGGAPAQYSYMPGATHNAAAAAASAGGWRPHGTAAGWAGGAAEEFGGHTGVVPVAMPPKPPKGVADLAMNQRADFKSDDDSILPRGGIDQVRACAVSAVWPLLLSMCCS